MMNWQPGVRPIVTKTDEARGISGVLRLILAVCVTLGLNPKEVASNMKTAKSKKWAEELSNELGESQRKTLEEAVHNLTKKT